MGEKLYTEGQMLATLRKYWPMGNDELYAKYLASLVPAPQPDKALVETVYQASVEYSHQAIEAGQGGLQEQAEHIARRLADRFGGWVSVEERLPEQDGEYLVTGHEFDLPDQKRFQAVAFFRGDTKVFMQWTVEMGDEGGWSGSTYVTHWRPLPAPPEVK
jgi:hypothetical protein